MKRRWLHLLWLVPLALVALVALLLVVVDTDFGRDFLRKTAVRIANEDVLAGHLEIAAIDGSIYSDLRIRGITLDDASGQRALELEELHLSYRLGALLDGIARVEAVELLRPVVHARQDEQGVLNLASLVKPSAPEPEVEEPPSEPLELEIQVARVALMRGEAHFAPAAGPALEVKSIELTSSATIAGSVIAAQLALFADQAEVRVENFVLAEDQRARGVVHLRVPAELVRAVANDPALNLEVLLDAKLSPGASLPWHVDLDAAISGAKLRGQIDASTTVLEAALTLRELDPQQLYATAPKALLALDVNAKQSAPGNLKARVSMEGTVDLLGDPVRLSPLVLNATLDGAALDAGVRLAALSDGPGALRLEGGAKLALEPALTVRSSSVALTLRSPATFAPQLFPLQGELALNARASGPIDDLAAIVEVRGSTLAVIGAQAAKTEAFAQPPRAHRSRARAAAEKAVPEDIGDAKAAVADLETHERRRSTKPPEELGDDPLSTLDPPDTRLPAAPRRDKTVERASPRVQRPAEREARKQARKKRQEQAAAASRGVKRKDAVAELDRLVLNANLAHLPGAASGTVSMQLTGLRAPPIAFDTASADLKINKGRSVTVDLRARGREFLRALTLSATATQSASGLTLALAELTADTASAAWALRDAKISRSNTGALTIENFALASEAGVIRAEGTIDPARLLDAPAHVVLAIERLQLAALAGFSPALAGLDGLVELDAAVDVADRNVIADVELDARGLERRGTLPLNARAILTLDRRALTASISAGGPDIGSLSILARGRAPKDPFDGASWPKEAELASLTANIPGLDLARLIAFTSTTTGIAGRVSGRANAGARFERADVELAVRDLSMPVLALPANIDFGLELGPQATRGQIVAGFRGEPVMRIDLDSNAGSEALRKLGVKALEQRGAELHLKAENVPAELLAVLARLDAKDPRFSRPRGRVSLWIDAKGAPPDVALTARVALEDVAFAERAPLLKLDLDAELERGRLESKVRASFAHQRGAVAIDLSAAVPKLADIDAWTKLDQRALRALKVGIEAFDLRTIEELGVAKVPSGKLDVELEVDAGLSGGRAVIDLVELRPNPELVPMQLAVRGTLGPNKQVLSATISAGATNIVELTAEVGAGLEPLVLGRVRDPRVKAEVNIPELELSTLMARPAVARSLGATKLEGSARYEDKTIAASAKLASGSGTMSLTADVPAGGSGRVVLDAKHFSLGFAGALARSLGGSAIGFDGTLEGHAEAEVDSTKLVLGGDLAIEAMRVVFPGAPSLERGKLSIALGGDQKKISLEGRLGKGALNIDLNLRAPSLAELDLGGEMKIDGMRYDAGGTVVAVDSIVKLNARRRGVVTEAEVSIGPTEISLPEEKGRALYTIRDFEDVRYVEYIGEPKEEQTATSTVPDDSKMRVKIATEKVIVARGGENALEISVDLLFIAEGGKKRLDGNVEIEQGRVSIVGKAYQFQRGLVIFDGSFPPNPRLDLRLAHDFPELSLLVLVGGTGKKPEVRFSSEPGGYDQATLLGFFVGGGPGESSSTGDTEDTARRAASGLLVSKLTATAKSQIPIDTLDVDLGDGTNRSGSVSAGKWVGGDIYIAYRYRFAPLKEENKSEGIIRWRFARRWTLEAHYGDAKEGAIDAIWLKRF